MNRAAGSLLLAVVIGAGLATGLARFPDPWSVALAITAGALVTRRAAHVALATAAVLAITAGAVLRQDGARSCAATLPLGEHSYLVRTVDPGAGSGRVAFLDGACRGTVAARWPGSVRIGADRHVAIVARWLPRRGLLGRPDGLLLVYTVGRIGGTPGLVGRSRTAVAATTARLFGDQAALVDALLAGRRGGLDRTLRNRFAAAGMVHLLAISGFHIALLAGWLLLLLRTLGVPARRAEPLVALAVLGYAAWLGWPAPATRAAALLATAVICRRRQRAVRPDGLLGTSALVVMLVDPWSITELGAWLSFAAVAGVIWSVRRLRRVVEHPSPWQEPLAASLGATLATAPIAALMIGRVALIGPLVNLVAIPLVAITVPALLLAVAVATIAPVTAAAFAASGGVLLSALDRLATVASRLPGAAGDATPGWRAALPWLLLAVVAWWATRERTSRQELLRRLGWGAAALLWWPLVASHPSRAPAADRLALHFLDVGQGDAAAIRTPGGHWLVIDAGPADQRFDAGARVVVPYLERAGVRRIAMLAISHAHRDHVGGAAAVARRWPVDLAIGPGEPFDEPHYLDWLGTLAARRVRWHPVGAGDHWELDGVSFRVLHPDTGWSGWGRDLNDDSVVLEVRYGAFRALLSGDAGVRAESLYATGLGRVELLKVGHHGSRGSSGALLLAATAPVAAVVSSGRNNYGHPSPEALARLRAAGTRVWRTDHEGAVTVETDGITFTVRGGRTSATRDARDPTDEAMPCCPRPR